MSPSADQGSRRSGNSSGASGNDAVIVEMSSDVGADASPAEDAVVVPAAGERRKPQSEVYAEVRSTLTKKLVADEVGGAASNAAIGVAIVAPFISGESKELPEALSTVLFDATTGAGAGTTAADLATAAATAAASTGIGSKGGAALLELLVGSVGAGLRVPVYLGTSGSMMVSHNSAILKGWDEEAQSRVRLVREAQDGSKESVVLQLDAQEYRELQNMCLGGTSAGECMAFVLEHGKVVSRDSEDKLKKIKEERDRWLSCSRKYIAGYTLGYIMTGAGACVVKVCFEEGGLWGGVPGFITVVCMGTAFALRTLSTKWTGNCKHLKKRLGGDDMMTLTWDVSDSESGERIEGVGEWSRGEGSGVPAVLKNHKGEAVPQHYFSIPSLKQGPQGVRAKLYRHSELGGTLVICIFGVLKDLPAYCVQLFTEGEVALIVVDDIAVVGTIFKYGMIMTRLCVWINLGISLYENCLHEKSGVCLAQNGFFKVKLNVVPGIARAVDNDNLLWAMRAEAVLRRACETIALHQNEMKRMLELLREEKRSNPEKEWPEMAGILLERALMRTPASQLNSMEWKKKTSRIGGKIFLRCLNISMCTVLVCNSITYLNQLYQLAALDQEDRGGATWAPQLGYAMFLATAACTAALTNVICTGKNMIATAEACVQGAWRCLQRLNNLCRGRGCVVVAQDDEHSKEPYSDSEGIIEQEVRWECERVVKELQCISKGSDPSRIMNKVEAIATWLRKNEDWEYTADGVDKVATDRDLLLPAPSESACVTQSDNKQSSMRETTTIELQNFSQAQGRSTSTEGVMEKLTSRQGGLTIM